MSADVYVIGLAGLSLIAVMIFALTARSRDDHTHDDRQRHSSSLVRDGRSN
ncbi:hypothetical protein LVO79_07815 [Roseivivax marinus]|jgi:hypothetical protein|uniref:hypothetical protein n=1 Tax=Roseivivax marinus TaxID=1379903 RepID=UPI0004B046E1|nr:hypothetical protein [Roseivivax marinus]UMA66339.1 hypothetical protein LVO79_07815 [Roseivivax marinus]